MKRNIRMVSAVLGAMLLAAPAAMADTQMKAEGDDEQYKETYQDDDGTKSNLEVQPDKVKNEYEDKECKQKYERDVVSGKVEIQTDCK